MNPSNIFGRPQTPFQATSNPNQSASLFQSFTQQNTTQGVGFGQTSAFTQPSFGQLAGQSSVFGQASTFGQTPAFGQSGGLTQGLGQPSSFSSLASTAVFGQGSNLGQETQGFGPPPPSYSQATGQNPVPAFGQGSAFSQPSGFGLSSSIPLSSTSFSNTTTTQPSFGQLSALPVPAATLNSSGGGRPENPTGGSFSFKPSNESVFKPIFSVSPEPPSSNLSSAPVPFGSSKAVTSSSTSGGSLFSCVKPSTLGFSFSQPAAAPSVSLSSSNFPQETVSGGNSIQFTFSQPANPTISSMPASQPTTPSSFSFTAKTLQPQIETKLPAFGTADSVSFGFGAPKTEASQRTEERADDGQSSGGETAFGSFAMKRKEEMLDPNNAQGKTAKSECGEAGAEGPRQPAKRPLLRTRGPGLFRSVMSDLLKSKVSPLKREGPPPPDRPAPPGPASDVPPNSQDPTDVRKAEEFSHEPDSQLLTSVRRIGRKESTDSLGGLSPTDATAIQCKGIPPNYNRKDLILQHFGHFGKVLKVYCRPQKNLAIVHFKDHASAAKAKKKGKLFQRNEIQIFWQRKKQSPSEKGARPTEVKDPVSGEMEKADGLLQSSPIRKPLPRSVATSIPSTLAKGSPIMMSSVAKTLQFESETSLESVSEKGSIERLVVNLPSVLQPLIGQVAETAEERYRLLEQRDKLLRQARPKRTDLDMSKVFVGTCPDMCPEKERYMRETRNQLSVYEVIPDTEKVDHFATIKEYSRSSADQEEPLPHELRPLPVLSMTMDYLVTQVMDQGEGNYRDWYDFVWNRTRGIRKDITQQHLCDPITVSLIEKCTRFHIHCAHHLCQEPMMSFDTKINNENMTKCLQSLKEMYQDLATKGVYCPNEAEFRQYNVLVKLNDGDILREVQQFRKDVQKSPEVDFAVQAFAELNSNNFVRFFKLVNSASYLSSCILHRYFNQVRSKALKILNIAYTVGSQRSTIFPVDDFVRMLMFRNAAEASDFIQQFGLNISDGLVELSRTSFQEPDFSLPQRKSIIIEKKRTVLIGEVVNGGPLPSPPQHNPVLSFDSNNKYTGDGLSTEAPPTAGKGFSQRQDLVPDLRLQIKSRLLAEPHVFDETSDTNLSFKPKDTEENREKSQTAESTLPTLFQPIFPLQPAKPQPPPPKPEPAYTYQDVMAVVDAVLNEVVEAEVSDVTRTAAEYVSTANSVTDSELEMVLNGVIKQMLGEISVSEIKAEKDRIAVEKRRMEEARRREAFLEQFSGELCAKISEEVLTERIHETAKAEIRFALEEKAAFIVQCSVEESNRIVEETLAEEVAAVAQEILNNELRRIRKFIKRWSDVVAVRRQLKRQMRGFPAAPGCVDPRFKLQALVPSAPSSPCLDLLAQGMVNLGNSGNMSVSCTRLLKMRQEAVQQMKVSYYYNLLLSERVWMPLDVPMLVAESVPDAPDRIFWKATILLPSERDCDLSFASRILTDWLEVKLGAGSTSEESEKEATMRTLCLSHSFQNVGEKTHEVYLSMKASHGPLSQEDQWLSEKRKDLHGTNALLILLPPPLSVGLGQEEEEEDVTLLSALLQLRQVQQASCLHSPVPLAVVVTDNEEGRTSDQGLVEALMLNTLIKDGLISEYIFIHIPAALTDLQGSEQMSHVVRWLASHSCTSPALSSQTLVQVVESGLCREFHSRLQRDKQDRKQAGLPSQHPEPIVQLCNSVLSFLASVVSSELLSSLCWPPPEFSYPENNKLIPHPDWNSPEHLDWLRRAILSRQLPKWDLPPISATWPQLCTSISK
ncbi:germinal-center associated nuclear protein isoform X2 [Triplophysa dalaica]|nr:germinal-center associated nuclear protein isoform X2 [Triplophysa dalaica]